MNSLSFDSYPAQVPFECYFAEDIAVGLGLRRKHLIAVSLLVGSDYNLNGVQGIGLETALRFVKNFHEDQVLQRFAFFLMLFVSSVILKPI